MDLVHGESLVLDKKKVFNCIVRALDLWICLGQTLKSPVGKFSIHHTRKSTPVVVFS